ncbi:Predicted helicase [Chryseolinea serpens]|uniref:Predicted helicase n=1 Tax=Chryseolinea serpens TaxID=947013 RepID=A0A1M5PCI8_9BACT|nr:type ISP restriction/modification enzyme [Chryseolinea serpens]SHG99447.1 Predicted helicase [Chryseolinea serpens]
MNQHLKSLFANFRSSSQTEREKGTYFEELIKTYLQYEATYKDLYSRVWSYAEWAKEQGLSGKDTGIDLVAQTHGTNEFHAIQCKFYDEGYCVQKKDIDSFFTASGKKTFTHRIIITTTNNWSENAEDALQGQSPPVTKIDLHDLANSQIDWSKFVPKNEPVLKAKKELRPHQEKALKDVEKGLTVAERGKLIMACGTGKTFTALKIAETLAGKDKRVLFLVPSLSLLSQTLTEWTQESKTPLHSFAVCSDSDIGKKRKVDDDTVQTFMHELRYPATTDAKSLAKEISKRHDKAHMSVVFSTYHSIDVISKAQKEQGLEEFDLVICDEAHRTTGATFAGEEESNFVKVHDNDFIKAKKRMYMTATPRIYADSAQAKAETENVALASMDDEELYGHELHVLTFSEAVMRGLLVDYKVIVLTVDEAHISSRLQRLLADENNQLKVDDAAKIVGCWKALSKQYQEDETDHEGPMRRAVAFCQVIEAQKGGRVHKVSSKNIASMFQSVVEAYQEQEEDHDTLTCEAAHVDGSMNASEKEDKLDWLKETTPENTCRILSNVRCLSEGVDVPALDAVLFLTPRNSQVDVVQSVGRIMRNAPGKTRGYVILPVVIPTGVEPHAALNDNKTYKVVWDVLQALRSHDDRFDAMINKFDLVGKDHSKMEVIAITDRIQPKQKKRSDNKETGKGSYSIGTTVSKVAEPVQGRLQFEIGEIERALYAKMVQKCGKRRPWEEWAQDIAKIAKTHITRITAIVNDPNNEKEVQAFGEFANELRDDLNDQITDEEVIEMLAQHLITKPVFDALFDKYSFASNNPVSLAMQKVLDVLQEHSLDKEADTLEKFYHSVKMRAEGIKDASAKQKIVVELYDNFFRNAFPRMTEKLGIVYTPVEVVDFIIHSVNDILKQEFDETLGSKGVHILDPFTGTGTFITRLLQSGLLKPEELEHKYKHEIHANEIVLLAYYIAAINIEAAYHGIMGGDYVPFEGICLTDTFQLYEKDDLFSHLMVDNSERRKRQKALDIRVIIGNPPYSAGQKSENDNAQNVEYKALDESIRRSYAAASKATLQKNLYDSYIRAIRWGSDRIKKSGVLAYVSNASYLDSNSMDGLRKCLAKEYSSLYIFHLRGDARTSGEMRRKEKDNVFGGGTRTPIAISVLVKNPNAKEHGQIFFYDIGDYLTREQKLERISELKSIKGIESENEWRKITPDEHNDWLNQRDSGFDEFIAIGDKRNGAGRAIFENYSQGILTSRDSWCFNFSKQTLEEKMKSTIAFYNIQVEGWAKKSSNDLEEFEEYIDTDSKKISWSRALKNDGRRSIRHPFSIEKIRAGIYRPFTKQWVYFDRHFNEMVYQVDKLFPQEGVANLAIDLSTGEQFSALMIAHPPSFDTIVKGQSFPLYLYKISEHNDGGLFKGQEETDYRKKDGITDAGFAHFKEAYPTEVLTKEDVFYYIYGILHSEEYREKYADNLSKQLPRIPFVKKSDDFWTFSKSGRDLAALHINYENVKPYDVILDTGSKNLAGFGEKEYYVTKMKFAKKSDKSTVIYNDYITIKNIPIEAYDYVVSGKPALEWVIERQGVKTDKDSGIVNDANLYAIDTVGDAAYPLILFQRIITVSLETLKIVRSLPGLDVMRSKPLDSI